MHMHELTGDPGILAGDDIGIFQDLESAQGDIGGVTNRCRDNIKARIKAAFKDILRLFTRHAWIARLSCWRAAQCWNSAGIKVPEKATDYE